MPFPTPRAGQVWAGCMLRPGAHGDQYDAVTAAIVEGGELVVVACFTDRVCTSRQIQHLLWTRRWEQQDASVPAWNKNAHQGERCSDVALTCDAELAVAADASHGPQAGDAAVAGATAGAATRPRAGRHTIVDDLRHGKDCAQA